MQAKSRGEKRAKPDVRPPGPEPEVLKIVGDWKKAIKKALAKKKPQAGWPK